MTSGIVQCMLVQALGYITTVTDEHNITMYNLSTLSVAKQVSRFVICLASFFS